MQQLEKMMVVKLSSLLKMYDVFAILKTNCNNEWSWWTCVHGFVSGQSRKKVYLHWINSIEREGNSAALIKINYFDKNVLLIGQ